MKSFVSEIKDLRTLKGRMREGCVIVEGYPEVRKALTAGVSFEALYVCPEIFQDTKGEFAHINKSVITKSEFARIAFGSRLKGILAVCRPAKLQFDDLGLGTDPIGLVLEGVEKPGNLGAILRSCDGAGVDFLVHCDGKTDIYNQHVVRSSIGTVFTVPVIAAKKAATYAFLKKRGFKVFAATAKAGQPFFQADFKGPSAIVIGNEHEGLSDFWLKQADESVTIPMNGTGTCLNAAASAAVLVYEALRQRQSVRVASYRPPVSS